tara:strand:+ start:528 stop:833 length:306 start_codon:yes stop_codon:yes gene_type:complete
MNKEEAIEKLREVIKEGDTLWTQLHHVTKSGMTRYIGVRLLKDDYPYNYTYHVAKALGWKTSDRYEGVKVGGCGMDMGFHLINSLSYALYGDGYAIKQRWL